MEQPPTPPPDSADATGKRARLLEDIFILVCIVSLWPVIVGWQHPVYEALLYTALAGLVFIFYRRINRFRDARREADQRGGNGR